MQWVLKPYEQLSKDELYQIMQARIEVFVVEQTCPYPEIDGFDTEADHLWLEDDGDIRAYCRIFNGQKKYEEASIGRILVKKKYRGQGHAKELLTKALELLEEREEYAIKLQAQLYLNDFYSSFGFETITDPYLEDGIPHVDMLLSKNPS